ncbi:MAG: hypothetical protein Q7T81_02715 [Pseudolabrys sp.]|nr:hypothetical protein [Pseudolabrys sp.]
MNRSTQQTDAVSLEQVAERAGAAWACSFSSSDEYNAAIIAERRAAGVYGPLRQRRQIFLTATGVAAGLGAMTLIIAALA